MHCCDVGSGGKRQRRRASVLTCSDLNSPLGSRPASPGPNNGPVCGRWIMNVRRSFNSQPHWLSLWASEHEQDGVVEFPLVEPAPCCGFIGTWWRSQAPCLESGDVTSFCQDDDDDLIPHLDVSLCCRLDKITHNSGGKYECVFLTEPEVKQTIEVKSELSSKCC